MASQRVYNATRANVFNRGRPSEAFLDELIDNARTWPAELYAPNAVPVDIFTVIRSSLGTPVHPDGDPSGTPLYQWDNLLHRKAALCEAMRVHAGMESSWGWQVGVDVTNRTSMRIIEAQETGIFQVSANSLNLGHGALKPFAKAHGIDAPKAFIAKMKSDHALALEYYARLVRVSIAWAGPLLRHGQDSVYPWLSRAAVAEFMRLLT